MNAASIPPTYVCFHSSSPASRSWEPSGDGLVTLPTAVKAVVSTPSGCAGLGLEHLRNVWMASSAAEFAAGISSLLEDPSLRRKMANDARRWVERQYHWGKIGEKQRGICNV